MTSQEAFELARAAVKRMAQEQGSPFRFTYDVIWTFLPSDADVPSLQRPGPQRRLIREGYIRKTGAMRNAASGPRARSLTPEYTFGRAILGSDAASSETRLIDKLKDDRTECYSVLATMSVEQYLNFVENAYYDREGGIEGQRGPLRTNTAIRIRRTMLSDLEAGAILPPVVVGLVVPEATLNRVPEFDDEALRNLLDSVHESNVSIIDGMQRTAALIDLRDKSNVMERPLRVEFWLTSNTNSLIYRMLVLNTGQIPWDLRRQIEVVNKSLLNELREHVSIEVLQKDDNRRRARPGQFQADRLVELYMVFGARKEKIDTKERLADEFTRLDFIEATSVSLFTRQFFAALQLLVDFDNVFDNYGGVEEVQGRFTAGRDLFSSQPSCVGFIAAVAIAAFGRPGAPEKSKEQQENTLNQIKVHASELTTRLGRLSPSEIGVFLDFETLNEVYSDRKVGKVGDFQREFFLKAFQTLVEEKFAVASMTPCWRAY